MIFLFFSLQPYNLGLMDLGFRELGVAYTHSVSFQ